MTQVLRDSLGQSEWSRAMYTRYLDADPSNAHYGFVGVRTAMTEPLPIYSTNIYVLNNNRYANGTDTYSASVFNKQWNTPKHVRSFNECIDDTGAPHQCSAAIFRGHRSLPTYSRYDVLGV